MSLINDALRRARHAQQSRAQATAGELPLQPVEPLRTSGGVPWTLFAAVCVAALILGGGLVWQLRSHHGRPATSRERPQSVSVPRAPVPSAAPSAPTPTTSAPSVAPAAPPLSPAEAPVGSSGGDIAQAAPRSAPTNDPPADAVVESPPADAPADEPPPAPPAPAFPALKLQGIFYSRTKPSALINGRTLFLGDQVEGAVVKRIDALRVEVEFNGQSRTLSLR